MRQNAIALLALFLALGGTTYAASTALPRNSVGSPQVINGSLQSKDLSKKARKALKGNRGLAGARGATGAQGVAGTPATKLFAAVSADCASVDRGSGATGVNIPFAARCDVVFNQSVKNCVPLASLRRDTGAGNYNTQVAAATNISGTYSGLSDDEIGVVYFDNAGNTITTNRPPFNVAVFC